MTKHNIPNFLVVGAAKTGSTALYNYMQQHPEIFLSNEVKESYFFIRPKSILNNGTGYHEGSVIDDEEFYYGLYRNVDQKQKAIGEVCTSYLYYYRDTIKHIKDEIGDPKIIIVIRNPIDRSYSEYLQMVRNNLVNETFEEALAKEKTRISEGWWWGFHPTAVSFYSDAIKAYLNNFSQVKIKVYDDFINAPLKYIQDIFAFLDVDQSFAPNMEKKHNISMIPKNKYLYKLIYSKKPRISSQREFYKKILPRRLKDKLIKYYYKKNFQKSPMNPETKEKLRKYFRNEILELQNLTGRNLAHWIE